MIQEAYVSFEIAKLLKEKGFNESIRCWYDNFQDFHEEGMRMSNTDCLPPTVMCPTHQMAMKWLREVHNIYIEISLYKTDKNDIEPKKSRKAPYYTFGFWNIITGDDIDKRLTNDFIGDTYEAAVEAALKYYLGNFIY